jgi:hypothetical protein
MKLLTLQGFGHRGLPEHLNSSSNPVAAAIAAAKVISTTPEGGTRAALGSVAGDPPRDVPEM